MTTQTATTRPAYNLRATLEAITERRCTAARAATARYACQVRGRCRPEGERT